MLICVNPVLLSSCTSKPTDLRTLVPAETLVYLETNDLAAALQPIVDSKPFRSVVTKKPDFSALKGVQVAVAVTGFETSEVAVTDEQAVGKVQPRFVAVADAHAWNYQAVAFAEKKLGSFVTEIYDAEPKLEKSDKHGGKYFTWTSQDGRKAFALVIDSLIYFGNDESAIDKALAVRSGQTDSIAKTGKLPPHVPGDLASGYVTNDGVAQIAALAGLHFASQASDEEEVQSAVAGILPQLIRRTVTDVSWSTSQTSEGIEDKWSVKMPAEVAGVLNETMTSTETTADEFASALNPVIQTATKYNVQNPVMAWESVVQLMKKAGGHLAPPIVDLIAPSLFEAYGIKDNKLFLLSSGPVFITSTGGNEDDKHLVFAQFKNLDGLKRSLAGPLKKQRAEVGDGVMEFFASEDKDFTAQFNDNSAWFGDRELLVRDDRDALPLKEKLDSIFSSRDPAPIQTVSNAPTVVAQICVLLSDCSKGKIVDSISVTETRFTKTGMDRRTVSDLGSIGWIIAQLASE